MNREAFPQKIRRFIEEVLLGENSEILKIKEHEHAFQVWGVCKFGKALKKKTRFYATISPFMLLSVEATEEGMDLLSLAKRFLGEPRGAYHERNPRHGFLKEDYTAEWYAFEGKFLDELDVKRVTYKVLLLDSDVEPISL